MPYMKHNLGRATVEKLQFINYEDVLGIAHSEGYSSIVVPGQGGGGMPGGAGGPMSGGGHAHFGAEPKQASMTIS